MYKVEKKNGNLEDYDKNKIVSAVIKAGGTKEEAEKVVSGLDLWLLTAAVNGVVKSEQIKVKGLEILKSINPTAAGSYENYKKV